MALPRSIEKARWDLQHTLSDPTPLYAVLGIADVAASTLRQAGSDVMASSGEVKTLPRRAQGLVDGVLTGALTTYGGLAGRGRSLLTRVRSSEETQELQHRAKSTTAKVRAAGTTTKKAAAATRTSAKSTPSTTRKSASTAKTAAKSAASSSRKTAAAARNAAQATAAKLGD
jgi:hypothetical protein